MFHDLFRRFKDFSHILAIVQNIVKITYTSWKLCERVPSFQEYPMTFSGGSRISAIS